MSENVKLVYCISPNRNFRVYITLNLIVKTAFTFSIQFNRG